MKSPHGEITHKEGRIFVPVKNAGHRRIRPGDWVLFKPHVRRSLYLVIRTTKPSARASRRFCGLACDDFKKGQVGRVQVYGPADPATVAHSFDFVQVGKRVGAASYTITLTAEEMQKPTVVIEANDPRWRKIEVTEPKQTWFDPHVTQKKGKLF